jgi:hypothetical protein
VSISAFGSFPIANPAVPLVAGFIGFAVGSSDLFLFSGVETVTCSVILQVAGFKVPETTEFGQFNVFDFTNIAADGLVEVDNFPVRNRKGSEKLKHVFGVLPHLTGAVREGT